MTRREVLAGAALGVTTLAGCAGGNGSGGSAERADFDGWLTDVSAYNGITVRTGRRTVAVAVGGGDGLSFEPAAISVDVGTTVRWEWTGGGSAHNVVAKEGTFESNTYAEAGRTFERRFATAGVFKYLCVPHEYAGMKGVIVVGD